MGNVVKMTNYEKLGFDEIVKWLSKVNCEYCLAQKYCDDYNKCHDEGLVPCDKIVKEYLELDSTKGAEYFLTCEDIEEDMEMYYEDDEDDGYGSELTFKAIHISDDGEEEVESELRFRGL